MPSLSRVLFLCIFSLLLLGCSVTPKQEAAMNQAKPKEEKQEIRYGFVPSLRYPRMEYKLPTKMPQPLKKELIKFCSVWFNDDLVVAYKSGQSALDWSKLNSDIHYLLQSYYSGAKMIDTDMKPIL